MVTEFLQSNDAPGVQVQERATPPIVQQTSDDIGAFAIVTRRGPTSRAVARRNFKEFSDLYGGFHDGNFGPILVDKFFEQRDGLAGGSLVVISRIVGAGAAKGSVTLKDSNNVLASAAGTVKINAENVGKWSNDAATTTRKYLLETTATILNGATSVTLNSTVGVEVGDLVKISDGTTDTWVHIRSIDLATKTINFRAVVIGATITIAAAVEGLTVHRASSVTAEVLNHNSVQVQVGSGRNFRKGQRVLIEDVVNNKITSVLVTRVNKDLVLFAPIQLTESGTVTGTVTSVAANKFTDSALTAFNGLTHNLVGRTITFTAGTGAGQTARIITAIDTITGVVTLDANLEEDLDATSTYSIAATILTGQTPTTDGNGVRALGTIEIINNAYDGSDSVTLGATEFLATAFDTGTIAGDATTLAGLITASVEPVTAQAVGGVITIIHDSWVAATGNAFTLAEIDGATDNFTLSGATLAGGVTPTTFADLSLNGFEDDLFNTGTITFTDGLAALISGSPYTITDFTKVTGLIEAAGAFATNPLIGNAFNIAFTFTGTVTASTNNTLISDDLSAANNFGENLSLSGLTLTLLAGTGFPDSRTISGFDPVTGTVTVSTEWTIIPDGTTTFEITGVTNKPFSFAIDSIFVTQEFSLLAYDLGVVIETHAFLSMEPTSEDYIETRLAGDSNESVLFELEDLSSAIYSTDPIRAIPLPVTRASLSGGLEGSVPTNDEAIGESGINKTGIFLFDAHQISYFSIPGFYNFSVLDRMRAYGEGRGDVMPFSSVPQTVSSSFEAEDYRKQTLKNMSSSQVVVYPQWHFVRDPESSNPNSRILVPPEGVQQGLASRVAKKSGIHFSPANEIINGILGVNWEVREGSDEAGSLNNNGLNAVIFDGANFLTFGARTFWKGTGKRKFISSRRILNLVIRSARGGNRFAAFQPNDDTLSKKLKRANEGFLRGIWRQGFLVPLNSQAEAFEVVTDETINPRSLIAEGFRFVDIVLEPQVPAEKIRLRVGITSEVGVTGIEES